MKEGSVKADNNFPKIAGLKFPRRIVRIPSGLFFADVFLNFVYPFFHDNYPFMTVRIEFFSLHPKFALNSNLTKI